MISVAIVSPKLSLEPISKVIDTHDFGCQFHKYVYQELSDIEWIYADCKDSCDVIFFSGELGYHYILNHIPDIRIPCAFTAYGTLDILSILLKFVIEHPDIPLSRVHVDFLTPLNNFMEIKRYLSPEHMPYCYESFVYDYEHITARAKALWDAGKIDVILTRSINNIKMLEKMGIPYIAVFPTEQMIAESIEAAVNDLRLARDADGDHIVTIIRLLFGSAIDANEREYQLASLHKLLVDYRKESGVAFSITAGFDRFELQLVVPSQPENSTVPQALIFFLQKHANFDFRCGCGISRADEKSHYYAETALLEALKYGGNDGFMVSGEKASLTGPLSVSRSLTYSYQNVKANAFAREIGISESNLVKLVGLFRLDEDIPLTAVSVSRLLNVATRSGSRILQQLLETELIVEVPSTATSRKGRPTREYRFMAENFRNTLL